MHQGDRPLNLSVKESQHGRMGYLATTRDGIAESQQGNILGLSAFLVYQHYSSSFVFCLSIKLAWDSNFFPKKTKTLT